VLDKSVRGIAVASAGGMRSDALPRRDRNEPEPPVPPDRRKPPVEIPPDQPGLPPDDPDPVPEGDPPTDEPRRLTHRRQAPSADLTLLRASA
jgi:hypothetical protein